MDTTDLIGYAEAAKICGVKLDTMHWYHRRSRKLKYPPGLCPRPKALLDGRRDRPLWDRVEFETWNANRPGPGNHTRGADRKAHNGAARVSV